MDQSKTILIIDDEEMIRDLARDILEMQGYTVLSAKDGIEGMTVYKENWEKIGCIILDLTMPRMSGRETYFKLREINKEAKIILSTGYGKDERTQEIISLGVQDVVQKPYRIDDLIGTVEKTLRTKK
jgi:DNA-binding NtrC family response regulator